MTARKHILIVEDNSEEAAYLEKILSPIYEVQVLNDGQAALTLVRTGHEFDLIILDIRMPGMTGDRVLKGIRQIGNMTEVLILSAFDASDVAITTLTDGAFEFLMKPISKSKLLAKVAQALEAGEMKKTENISQQYQHRRNHFKRHFTHSFAHSNSGDEEWSDRHVRHELDFERAYREL